MFSFFPRLIIVLSLKWAIKIIEIIDFGGPKLKATFQAGSRRSIAACQQLMWSILVSQLSFVVTLILSYCVKWKLLIFSNKIWIFALKKLLGFPWFLRVASIWISRQSIRVFLAFESSVFKSSSIVWIYALKCFSFFYTSWLLGIWIFAPKKLLGISKLKSLVLKALISSVYLIYTFSN